jgi:hypothetical protein
VAAGVPDVNAFEGRDTARSGDRRASPVAAAVLAHCGHAGVLAKIATDGGPGRLWTLEALGDLTPAKVEAAAGGALDTALIEVLEPVWMRHVDWMRTEENYAGLEILGRQRLRFDPVEP